MNPRPRHERTGSDYSHQYQLTRVRHQLTKNLSTNTRLVLLSMDGTNTYLMQNCTQLVSEGIWDQEDSFGAQIIMSISGTWTIGGTA